MIPDEIHKMIKKHVEKRPSKNDSNFNYIHQENVFLIVEKTIELLQHRTTENMWLRLKAFTQTLLRKASHILKRCTKVCCL